MRLNKTFLYFILIFSSNFALSSDSVNLSFKPVVACKRPPSAPPKKILERFYKTYIPAGRWSIFDINGDGWCDWVRGGNEGYRSDEEYPHLQDFIYLGTAKGWRHFDKKYAKLQSLTVEPELGKTVVLPGDAAALTNFLESKFTSEI